MDKGLMLVSKSKGTVVNRSNNAFKHQTVAVRVCEQHSLLHCFLTSDIVYKEFAKVIGDVGTLGILDQVD